MMITEHAHGQFMVTLDPEEVDQLTALIEGQQTTEDFSPCCAVVAEHLTKMLANPGLG